MSKKKKLLKPEPLPEFLTCQGCGAAFKRMAYGTSLMDFMIPFPRPMLTLPMANKLVRDPNATTYCTSCLPAMEAAADAARWAIAHPEIMAPLMALAKKAAK